MSNNHIVINYYSDEECSQRTALAKMLKECPVPASELMDNIGMFITSKTWSRLRFLEMIYEKIVEVPGVIMEFGTRWGQNLSLFSVLRGIHEPFNRQRKIIGFDTFSGFPSTVKQDGKAHIMKPGSYSTTEGYESFLSTLMDLHEKENPLSHIKKYELIKGNAVETVPQYITDNPETIIALAYFDFDLYEPTKHCLEVIRSRLIKGSVLAFDELNEHSTPGETQAVMEVFGLNNLALRRSRNTSRTAYCVFN